MDYTHESFIVQADCYRSPNLGLFTGSDFCSHQGLGWHVTFTCKPSNYLLFSRDGRPPTGNPPRGEEESQNRTGQKCTAYELVRRQFFNTIKVWLMTFQCVLVIQSSLSLYPKLIDKKNTVLAKLIIVPKSARRTSSYADIA